MKRPIVALVPLLAALSLSIGAAPARAADTVDVYKTASCGCCGNWVDHLKKAGLAVKVIEISDLPGNRKKLGMPEKFASCHTAKVGNYLVEGHVPATDIKRLLKDKPKALGIAVPGMPPGSPGMDIPNSPPYETLLVQSDGSSKVFAKH